MVTIPGALAGHRYSAYRIGSSQKRFMFMLLAKSDFGIPAGRERACARGCFEHVVNAVDPSAPHSAYARVPISCLTAYAARWDTSMFRTGKRERECASELLFVFG